VADVKHFNLFLFSRHAIYRAIYMRFVAVQQMPELIVFGRYRASVWLLFQTENRLFEPAIPFQGRVGIPGIDLPVQVGEIAARRGR
jgi:hypothetical protein